MELAGNKKYRWWGTMKRVLSPARHSNLEYLRSADLGNRSSCSFVNFSLAHTSMSCHIFCRVWPSLNMQPQTATQRTYVIIVDPYFPQMCKPVTCTYGIRCPGRDPWLSLGKGRCKAHVVVWHPECAYAETHSKSSCSGK